MSFEPGEDWFFDYEKQRMIAGVDLAPPHAHPTSQPAPRTERQSAGQLAITPAPVIRAFAPRCANPTSASGRCTHGMKGLHFAEL